MTIPVPALLPEPTSPQNAEQLALDLYQQLSAARQAAADAEAQAIARLEAQAVSFYRIIAALARFRFGLHALIKRLDAGGQESKRILDLFAREWDKVLDQHEIRVRDLTGLPFTDEVAALVEDVRGALPDLNVAVVTVCETIVPVVTWRGQVIGRATILKAVPTTGGASGPVLNEGKQ